MIEKMTAVLFATEMTIKFIRNVDNIINDVKNKYEVFI
jgi:hypothetical protein